MTGNNQVQKDELILPGGLGEVTVASTGEKLNIIKAESNEQMGSMTLTLVNQITRDYLNRNKTDTEDIPCEIIQPKQLNDANNHQTSQPV